MELDVHCNYGKGLQLTERSEMCMWGLSYVVSRRTKKAWRSRGCHVVKVEFGIVLLERDA